MRLLIGVDIGTQGTKAALFAEDGACLSHAFRRSKLHQPRPGVVEEDPERQFSSVCRTIKACVGGAGIDPAAVAGIGIDGQMAGILGVGDDGHHVTPYDSWLDTRCAPYIKRMEARAGARVLKQTGCPPSFNHGPKILWWRHERRQIYRHIAAFVTPGAYAAMRLCGLAGADAFVDKTYLQFSGFADNRAAAWDAALCETFGVDPAKLPAIVDSRRVVGEVAASVARRCGLHAGTPVVAGCGDTVASFLACGAVREGICVDVAGTASVFAATTTAFRADVRHRTLGCGRSPVPGLWYPYAYINGGGMNLEWLRRELANQGKARGRDTAGFERLDALAAKLDPREDDPLFVPHLGGRVCPSQPGLRGAWTGLTWDHSLGHLYRAVLEGVALEYGIYKEILAALYKDLRLREVRITGGGERSAVWNRIKADALQTPVRRIARDEGAPLGAALVAGCGVGVFRSLPAVATRWVQTGERLRPRSSLAKHYAHRLARYKALLARLDE